MTTKLSKEEKAAAKFARDLAWFKRETTPEKLEAVWRESESGGSTFIGPVGPPMFIYWCRGERGWPFNHRGGPLPGTINYCAYEELFG